MTSEPSLWPKIGAREGAAAAFPSLGFLRRGDLQKSRNLSRTKPIPTRRIRPDISGVGSENAHDAVLKLSESFIAAAVSHEMVTECPHNIYKYPARFSPEFAREAIKAFTHEGDLVIEPFCGGGTALIEAVAAKRRGVGFDISSLACFIARARTTPLSIHDQSRLEAWINRMEQDGLGKVNIGAWNSFDTEAGHYKKNLPQNIVAVLSGIIERIGRLETKRQQYFARWILLSVGQSLLDCRRELPTAKTVLPRFCSEFRMHLASFRDYTWCLSRRKGYEHRKMFSMRRIINASSENLETDWRFPAKWGKAKLVVTSPPYPGVHMLYHRWQILGRKETPAPFLLADCRDGNSTSYYCLGDRRNLSNYFTRIKKVFAAVRTRLDLDAIVVQMVAFNDPAWQLPAYLAAMVNAGYAEIPVSGLSDHIAHGRLWRTVPGRRWYAAMSSSRNAASNEVVLFHRPL